MTREEAIKILKLDNKDRRKCSITEAINMAIKSLEQEPKMGHWIADVDKWGDVFTTVNGYRCSECECFNSDKDNYCPNCGAKMESEEV